MKRCAALFVAMLVLVVAQSAVAQTGSDSTAKSSQSSSGLPATAGSMRYGAILGGWLTPSGDIDQVAGSGWTIALAGYSFLNPQKMIAIGTDIGYQSFGKKNGVTVSNFPVDAVLKVFPKAQSGKARLFLQGGLGFNYTKVEIGNASDTEYNFGTQAGGGLELHTDGPVALMADATYHWVFATGTDLDFISIRAGLMVPLMR